MDEVELSTSYPVYQTAHEYASSAPVEQVAEASAASSAQPRTEEIDPDMGRYVNLFI